MEYSIDRAERRITEINKLHDEVQKEWPIIDQRIIGCVAYAPAIAVGDGLEGFTRDWVLIKLYRTKFDSDTYQGNKIYVGAFLCYLWF